MLLTSCQQAWIRGLPGLDQEGGISCNTLPVPLPTPDKRSLKVTLYGSSELISSLLLLSKKRTKLSQLSITIRTDAAKELDDQIQLTGVVVDSVTPLADKTAVQVSLLFNGIYARMGVTLNPGPPFNCPPVQPTGVNRGWIFGLPYEDLKSGKPVDILDFIPPHDNRRLMVSLGTPPFEIEDLVQNPTSVQELILVLPDRISQRYVEFKVWNPKVTMMDDLRKIAFDSNRIVCLTGLDA